MRRAILWTLVGLLVLAGKGLGRQKVGTTGAKFLGITSSTRAAGLAAAGVALTGHDNWLANPACLGLRTGCREVRTAWTTPTDEGFAAMKEYDFASARFSTDLTLVGSRSFHLGVAPYYGRLKSFTQVEIDYSDYGSSRTFTWTDRVFGIAAGLGWEGPVQISAGLGVKYVRQEVNDFDASGVAFDIGSMVRWPLRLHHQYNLWVVPSAGISWLNFGPDLTMISKEYPLDGSRRAGLAIAIMSTHDDNPTSLPVWELTGTFEHEEFLNRKHSYIKRLAVAFSVLQLVTLRAGDYLNEDYTWDYTYGYTLDSRGLIRLLGASAASPWSRFSVSLSQAFLNSDQDDVLLDIGLAYRL